MDLESKHILIAEDDILLSIGIESIIKNLGFHISGKCSSGKNLIDKALKLKPDLIIADILLNDDINGIEALKEIQKSLPDVKVIYVTADSDPNMREKAEDETGFIGYFLKPIDLKKLQESIKKA